MSDIKCTYAECFRRFKTQELMKRHKAKEPEHDYCKRCDVDCNDDLDYLIHQISSANHICCPVDGMEFQSKSGRDAHVESMHPQKQSLICIGCNLKFTKAAALMFHIENDECKVIRLELFERQRAETQIRKDAWASSVGEHAVAFHPADEATPSEADTNGGASLLDDDRGHISRDWAGRTHLGNPLRPQTNGPYRAPYPAAHATSDLGHGLNNLTLDKFPALPAQSTLKTSGKSDFSTAVDDGDLIDLNQPEERIQMKPKTTGRWATGEPSGKSLFPQSKPSVEVSGSQLGPMDSMSQVTSASHATSAMKPPPSTMFDYIDNKNLSQAHSISSVGAAPSTSGNPHVTTTPQIRPPSILDPYAYWHNVYEKFVCPGTKCGRHFDTPEGFSAHLLTGAHVGGRTVCPSCLRKFNTTTALIAHCESAARKCNIRKSINYNQTMRELTGGLIGTDGFLGDGGVRYTANPVEDW